MRTISKITLTGFTLFSLFACEQEDNSIYEKSLKTKINVEEKPLISPETKEKLESSGPIRLPAGGA